ncbi:MAG: MBL fold metallo-hydrolase [Proteobacteria bacterium]|nr:MBL fold metallo-hydrolase [Pseudomonadota bacterium]
MPKTNPYYAGPLSDHFDGLRFLNPAGEPETDRTLAEVLRWRRSAPNHRWPRQVPVSPARPEARVSEPRITMVGHATVLIQAGGLNILTDPVWSERASPLRHAGPRRVTVPGIALADLPPIDAVLLSHNHYDHLDLATLRLLHRQHAPLIVTPLGNDTIVRRRIADARLVALDWGQNAVLPGGAQAWAVPALHWSSRGPRDRRMALWGGFMLQAAGRLIYFAGDTGYGTGAIFRRLRAQFGPVDIALLPIGAYDPRWFMAAQHTDPAEAVAIMQHLEAKRALGIHWGTFKLTDEPREDPLAQLDAALAAQRIEPGRFIALHPGQVVDC